MRPEKCNGSRTKKMKIVTAVLVLFLTLPAFAADPTGKWKAAMQGPDGEMQLTFNFKLDGDKVTGTVEGPMGEMPITEGKMEGDAISFTVETPTSRSCTRAPSRAMR
jgi:hypothetical protein